MEGFWANGLLTRSSLLVVGLLNLHSMVERAWYQVARLTRPARLRCRPAIAARTTRWHRHYASASAGITEPKLERSRSPLKGVERRDYEDALAHALENGTGDARSAEHGEVVETSLTAARNVRLAHLPSLLKHMTDEATLRLEESLPSAGPSSQPEPSVPSRKGKERAKELPRLLKGNDKPKVVDVASPEAQPAAPEPPKAEGMYIHMHADVQSPAFDETLWESSFSPSTCTRRYFPDHGCRKPRENFWISQSDI